MEFQEFLIQYAVFPIAIICFMVGEVIKHYINFIPNKYIPLILGCLGLLLNLSFNNFTFTFEIIITGIASGLASTGGFEAVRNLAKKKQVNNEVGL